jgi:hypothetical protein
MASYEKITARVQPFVKADLKALRRQVGEHLKQPLPSQDDLVAALIHSARAPQTAKALQAYWGLSKPWEDDDPKEAAD